MDGCIVRHVGGRPGDRLRSMKPQRAATVAHLAEVRTWQGEAHVAKPPSVIAHVRVDTLVTGLRAGPPPYTHDDLFIPWPVEQTSPRVCASRCRVGALGDGRSVHRAPAALTVGRLQPSDLSQGWRRFRGAVRKARPQGSP